MANYKSSLSEVKGSDKFIKVVTLQCDCGAETLRRRIEKELDTINKSLKDYLKTQKHVNPLKMVISQNKSFSRQLCSVKPSLDAMDVTLLTHIMDTFTNLSTTERQNILQLRRKRNLIAHIGQGKFDNNLEFNETKKVILDIAKDTNKECYEKIKTDIQELESRKLVRPRGNGELIMFNGEKYMVQLIEIADKDDIVDPTLWIRLGLTKWIKEMSRYIDMGPFLVRLKEAVILSTQAVTQIQNSDDKEEQCNCLVLELLKDGDAIGRESVLLRFCKLLRVHNRELANLIENNSSDGKDSEAALLSIETTKVKEVLSKYVKHEEKKNIKTEEIHILVEEEIGWSVDFSVIDRCARDIFEVLLLNATETRYEGLNWKEDEEKPIEEPLESNESIKGHLSCEDLAEYLFQEFQEHSTNVAERIKDVIIAETISSKIFITMTKTQLEDVLGKHNINFGIGISTILCETQSRFQSFTSCYTNDGQSCIIRPFDIPTGTLSYTRSRVRPAKGNLLVPVHQFISNTGSRLKTYRLINEVVKFTAACLNTRQNGTIHFGIKPSDDGTGRIVGIKLDQDIQTIDSKICKGIEASFQEDLAHIAKRCVRPSQVIAVDKDAYVLEIDIVPYSGHVGRALFDINYPVKGKQKSTFFIHSEFEILPVTSTNHNEKQNTMTSCMSFIDERNNLEQSVHRTHGKRLCHEEEAFVNMLRRGNEYINDELVPIIFCGNSSGCQSENYIRQSLTEMNSAFLASKAVFDFDSMVTLRNLIEEKKKAFKVMRAEDFVISSNENTFETFDNVWVHCNGNNELGLKALDREKWYNERFKKVEYAIKGCRNQIQKDRALVVFLIFEDIPLRTSPMFEIVRECMMRTFKDECIVISENKEAVQCLIDDLSPSVGKTVNNFFLTGFKWRRVCEIIKTLFRDNRVIEMKLPHSGGHFVEMTQYEKEALKFKDIDVLSGTQCNIEETKSGIEKLCQLKKEEETKFYQGNPVTWWNFYFKDQVGERSIFSKHKLKIQEKLSDTDEEFIEFHEIQHQPGAGGSTIGMNLLWEFSQFDVVGSPGNAYRCCVVNTISDETANEIARARNYKDDNPKPIILLLDNKSDENVNVLKATLHKLAYKTAKPGTLYCLLIEINRVSTHKKSSLKDLILEHKLTTYESTWFKTKYEKLESNNLKTDVDTLIAFNVMRNSFDRQFIKSIVHKILNDVTPNEKKLLKCLSLINSFENDQRIPPSAFDQLMENESGTANGGSEGYHLIMSFGITDAFTRRADLQRKRKVTWNNTMTNASRLLIIKRNDSFERSGIALISRPLAQTILDEIMQSDGDLLEDITNFVLKIVKVHIDAGFMNPHAKQFVSVINNLFITRLIHHTAEEVMLEKSKFSDLVLELEKTNSDENKDQGRQRVVRTMTHCFNTTHDPFVGQHLARYNIFIKDFEAAEMNIKESLELFGKPNLSLLDTYGQIFRFQMKMLIDKESKIDQINDKMAAKIIELCFNAIEQFKQAQMAATLADSTGSYMSEVETALTLLEAFDKFKCFKDRKSILLFLHSSKPDKLIQKPTNLHKLCYGHETQVHLEESLRTCEERGYQVKSPDFYTIYTKSNESLLLSLRERYERFYGETTSKLQFSYGLGLKPLMKAATNDFAMFNERFAEAKNSIIQLGVNKADSRELLIVLGYAIIAISSDNKRLKDINRELDFPVILQYSRKLVEKQKASPRRQYLEGFLYHAMFHWPTIDNIHYTNLSPGKSYENYLREWKMAFERNLKVKGSKFYPKIFFALKKGVVGDTIVDFKAIEKQWKKQKHVIGRTMKHVKEDNFWKEPFVEDILNRLEGSVSDDGYTIAYTAQYEENNHVFHIKADNRYLDYSNRVVTFVLGFTWGGLIALDVELKEQPDKLERKGIKPLGLTDILHSDIPDHGKQLEGTFKGSNKGAPQAQNKWPSRVRYSSKKGKGREKSFQGSHVASLGMLSPNGAKEKNISDQCVRDVTGLPVTYVNEGKTMVKETETYAENVMGAAAVVQPPIYESWEDIISDESDHEQLQEKDKKTEPLRKSKDDHILEQRPPRLTSSLKKTKKA